MSATEASGHLPPLGARRREEAGRQLQAMLVELIDLPLFRKQLHWTVIGPRFRPLHLQLGELTDAWRGLADTIGRWAVAIGFIPDGQSAIVVAGTPLPNVERRAIDDRTVVRELSGRVAERMDRLGELDAVSQDVVIEVVRTLEEQLWMVRAEFDEEQAR